jgi:hypothetical protein
MNNIIEKELDQIIFEEYEITPLLEDKDNEGGVSTPIQRMISFPSRAIRYRKAKNVMSKYSKKILSRSEKIIKKFEGELEKSIIEIERKGNDLQNQLLKARNAGKYMEEKAIINQQKKFKADVEKNQSDRINHLNQSIDSLIGAYTTGIHKRIDEPGYILKVELSERGKTDLKFLWEEYISTIKQQIYEKLIQIINNKHVKGMESLIARLEVEIEDAEDRRQINRRSRTNIFNQEKREYIQEKKKKESEEKIDKEKPEEEESKEEEFERKESFNTLKKHLDDGLPEGILDEDEAYSIQTGKPPEFYDLYFEIDDKSKTITALFYKKDTSFRIDKPIKTVEIDDIDIADKIINMIQEGEETQADIERDAKADKYTKNLINDIDTLFKTREKRIKEVFSSNFYNKYKDFQTIRSFSKFIIGEIMDDPEEYDRQLKLLQNPPIADKSLLILFLKEFRQKYETQNESFVSFKKYKYYL